MGPEFQQQIVDTVSLDHAGEKKNAAREKREPVSRETIQDFFRSFLACIKALKLYPGGHKRLEAQFEQCCGVCERIFSSEDSISIFIKPDTIYCNEEEFTYQQRFVLELAPEFVKRLIRYVVISREIQGSELERFAGLFLQDPEEMKEKKETEEGPYGGEWEHIRIVEFSYDMDSIIQDAEDLKVVKALSRTEGGTLSEEYILQRMKELKVDKNEYAKLGRMLSEKDVSEKLNIFQSLINNKHGEAAHHFHTSDLLFYLVRTISHVEQELETINEDDVHEIVSCILDRICDQMFSPIKKDNTILQQDIISKVSGRMFQSPEALLKWISPQVKGPVLGLSENQSELLKVLFHRVERKDSLLVSDEDEESSVVVDRKEKAQSLARRVNEVPAQYDVEKFNAMFTALEKRIGSNTVTYDQVRVFFFYTQILFAMFRSEQETVFRKLLFQKMRTVLSRNLENGSVPEGFLLSDLYFREGTNPAAEETEILFEAPKVAEMIIREYGTGEARWEPVLVSLAETCPDLLACPLGRIIVDDCSGRIPDRYETLVRLCEDSIMEWIRFKLTETPDLFPVSDVVTFIENCAASKPVQLIKKLLEFAEPADGRRLLEKLARIDDRSAVGLLCMISEKEKGEGRSQVLRMLGRCTCSLAEERLLDIAGGQPPAEELLLILSLLEKNGTSRSIAFLKKLVNKYIFSVGKSKRKIKPAAKKVLQTLEMRNRKQGGVA